VATTDQVPGAPTTNYSEATLFINTSFMICIDLPYFGIELTLFSY